MLNYHKETQELYPEFPTIHTYRTLRQDNVLVANLNPTFAATRGLDGMSGASMGQNSPTALR